MPFVRYKTANMRTMREVAEVVGVDPCRFWRLVRERQVIEGPTAKAGRREYYDVEQIPRIAERIARLREMEDV